MDTHCNIICRTSHKDLLTLLTLMFSMGQNEHFLKFVCLCVCERFFFPKSGTVKTHYEDDIYITEMIFLDPCELRVPR